MKKIAVFADVHNLYYTVRDGLAGQFNYAAWWQELAQRGQITEAHAFAIERGDSRQQQFQQALRDLGFTVHLKPFIQRKDGSAKGDWDVGITIAAMDAARHVDELVLGSGDGDFDRLLGRVKQDGVNTVVYGVPGLTAFSLQRAANEFRSIDDTLLMRSSPRTR